MFPVYPKFENLPLRVEVQWRGRTRPVVARVEQWPDSGEAVLVCAFDDEDDGEWIILEMEYDAPYEVNRSDIPSKWERVVRKAFARQSLTVGRLFFCSKLSRPQMALVDIAFRGIWFSNWREVWRYGPHRVRWRLDFNINSMSAKQVECKLLTELNWAGSNTQFSHLWTQWSASEKRAQLTGFKGDFNEAYHTMKLIACVVRDKNPNSKWRWDLSCYKNLHFNLWDAAKSNAQEQKKQMLIWENLFLPCYVPHFRVDWINKYPCVRHFLREERFALCRASMEQIPSFHEQLEAKLQLRDWLQDKATPAEIEQLLAI